MIKVCNLSFRYRAVEVLRDVSFELAGGSFTAVIGPNGAGKTTLLKLLTRRLKPSAGTISIEGRGLKSYGQLELARKVAVVKQQSVVPFGYSVIEAVLMARTPYFTAGGFETQNDRVIAARALQQTDTSHLAERDLNTLSAGERQRVLIARALAQQTPVLVLDEPTSNLDLKGQVRTLDLLKRMQSYQEKTIVLVTHDLNLAVQYCDHMLLLSSSGEYTFGAGAEILTQERIRRTFGVKTFATMRGKRKFFIPVSTTDGKELREEQPEQKNLS